jgi:hypothetical protein
MNNKKIRIMALIAFFLMLVISETESQYHELKLIRKDNDKSSVQDTFPPLVTSSEKEDGTVEGIVIDMPDDDKIRSNLSGIHMSLVDNYVLTNDSIVPGKTRSARFKFSVVNKFKDATADVEFKDWVPGNTAYLKLRYKAPRFRITPQVQNFVDVVTGQKLFTEFLIINESYDNSFLLKEVKLNHGNKGFRIVEKNEPGYLGKLPKYFGPRDSVLVQIEFNAKEEGFFSDSLGIGFGYIFSNMAQVSANVLSPIIVAEDYNFFDLTRGDTLVKQLSVKNTSKKVDLILTGYSAVRHPFRTDLPQITEDEPRILKPGFQLNFNIYFTPDSIMDYKDSVVFSSNAIVKDHITRLDGRGVKPGLLVTSHDWGRRRIDRPDRPELSPVQPYTNSERAVWLENTTQDTIHIFDIETLDIAKGYAFEFLEGSFPTYLAPREPKFVEIAFHPIEVGYHEVKLKYITSLEDEIYSTFKGIGIAPKISSSNVDFGTTTMFDYLSPNSRRVVFKNERWEFEDLLEIKDLIIKPNGDEVSDGFSNSSTSWGSEGFKIYYKNKSDNPPIINPGDSLTLDINFSAQHEGLAYAEIRTFSDALVDTVSILTGNGLYRGLKAEVDTGSTCTYDVDSLYFKLIHYGFEDIIVDSMKLIGSPNFRLNNPNLVNGFYVLTGETKEFLMLYEPTLEGKDTAILKVFYNIDDRLRETDVLFRGQSYHTDRTYTMHLLEEDNLFGLDKKFKVRIMLDYGEDISFYRIGEISLRLEYNTNILEFDDAEDIRAELLRGIFRNPEIMEKNQKEGYIIFNCKRVVNESYLKGDGPLFNLTFKTIKPLQPDSSYKSLIKAYINTVGNHCVDFHNSNLLEVEINQSITDYLNWVDFNPEKNELLDVRPNPAEIFDPKVNFTIINEGFYKISIYNFLGQEAIVLFNDFLTSGTYEVVIPIEFLPAGSYFCYVTGTKFSSNKKFIIIK